MEAISKAELIRRIQEQMPDDAKIIGYSSMAGEAFELMAEDEHNGGSFFWSPPADEMEEAIEGMDLPEGTTHILEIC